MIECGQVSHPDPRGVPLDVQELAKVHRLIRRAALGDRSPDLETFVLQRFGPRERARAGWIDAS